MKTLMIATAFLALNAFAVEIDLPGRARNIHINHVTVGPIATETVEVPCTFGDSDLTCYKPVAFKDVVTLTVDYFTSPGAENDFETIQFDASEFSAEELTALSTGSHNKRMKAVNRIFALNIREEARTSTNTYCPYDVPVTCRADEYVTDTYHGTVKVVDVVKK